MTALRCNSCYNEITHVISLNLLFVTNPKFLKDINKRAVLKKMNILIQHVAEHSIKDCNYKAENGIVNSSQMSITTPFSYRKVCIAS